MIPEKHEPPAPWEEVTHYGLFHTSYFQDLRVGTDLHETLLHHLLTWGKPQSRRGQKVMQKNGSADTASRCNIPEKPMLPVCLENSFRKQSKGAKFMRMGIFSCPGAMAHFRGSHIKHANTSNCLRLRLHSCKYFCVKEIYPFLFLYHKLKT